jgi:hypothetical protein
MKAQGLTSLCALAEKIGRKDQRMTIYRVLGKVNKHAPLRSYVRLSEALHVDVDRLARIFLDYPRERAKNEFKRLMNEAGYPTVYALSKALAVDPTIISYMSNGEHQHIQIRVYRDISRGSRMLAGSAF